MPAAQASQLHGDSPACPVCGQQPCRAAWHYQQHTIRRCGSCGLEFAEAMQAGSLAFYQRQYGQAVREDMLAGRSHPGYGYVLDTVQRAQRDYLSPTQRRALDVGCGSGYLLSQLGALGFDALGIDFDPQLVAFAREHFHVRAAVSRVEDLAGLGAAFDLVMLVHVLEHVEAPLGLLQNIAPALAPHGLLLVEVPNVERFAVRRSLRRGELEWGEYPPHHLTFWSMSSLRRALELAGYSVLECRARPFSRDERVAAFLERFSGLPAGLRRSLRGLAHFAGQAAALQGDTVLALARRRAG